MSPKEAFNKEIRSFLNENPNSSSSITINKIMINFSNGQDFYMTFDTLADKLGVSFGTYELVDDKTENLLGFIPYFSLRQNNKLGIDERKIDLVNLNSPPKNLGECDKIIAKELVYRIQSLKEADWIDLK